ncbi:hypothetical protein [Bradyrhizobium sp. LA7.1]|uniref:hypothetical protein n=1 Tax=Bradyrhizobium sp. LA7.1 TaxID=3156324 RepID=UPI003397C561
MSQTHFSFEVSGLEFWRGLVDLVGGKGHRLKIGVIGNGDLDEETIEILGELPPGLRRHLRRAVVWDEVHTLRGKRCVQRGNVTWSLNQDGSGPSYAVPSMDALIGLLVARRKAMAAGVTER